MKPKDKDKPKEKNKGGRPPKYTTLVEVEERIEKYFSECKLNDVHPSMTGLALALDLTTQGLREYGSKEEFSFAIKRARQRVEYAWELRLLGSNATGPIFWLKNNAGWKDKHEREISGPDGGPIQVTGIDVTFVTPEKKGE